MLANGGKVIAIVGPTCTGKSDLALWLAGKIRGEIVNADSMQVYRRFDIGSAKPEKTVREEVRHHLIDVVEPDQEFNAARFQKTADQAVLDIRSGGAVPVVVGGTGLYLRVLFHGLFPVQTDPELREKLRKGYDENPLATYEKLKERDPEYARAISHRDRVRVVRGLEIAYLTGASMTAWRERHGFREQRYDVLKIGLRRDRRDLYDRTNARVEGMLRQGWVEEVEALLRAGYDPGLKPFRSIGYREIVLYLKGEMGYRDMVENIKTATRHYAKRQFTWFLREKDIDWYEYPEDRDAVCEKVEEFLR